MLLIHALGSKPFVNATVTGKSSQDSSATLNAPSESQRVLTAGPVVIDQKAAVKPYSAPANDDFEHMRVQRAKQLMSEARAYQRANPSDPWGYKERLDVLSGSYRSTPAGAEAVKILAELKLPAKPAPAAPASPMTYIPAPDDIMIADFEGKDYGTWKADGTAFGSGPARGTLPGQMHVHGYLGQGLVNSFNGGDLSIGTLTSPDFKIERKAIHFLIGGGGFEGKTCMNLIVDNKVVRTATGTNKTPGGSEELAPASWEVSEFAGKTAHIQIVDNATGGWGHILVDQIFQSNNPLADQLRSLNQSPQPGVPK